MYKEESKNPNFLIINFKGEKISLKSQVSTMMNEEGSLNLSPSLSNSVINPRNFGAVWTVMITTKKKKEGTEMAQLELIILCPIDV